MISDKVWKYTKNNLEELGCDYDDDEWLLEAKYLHSELAKKGVFDNKNPWTQAGGFMYLVSNRYGLELTQANIAIHMDMATPTLRNHYKRINFLSMK